jgi:hypothetical protein
MANRNASAPRFFGSPVDVDSTAPSPRYRSDLLQRTPLDVEPQPSTCESCGAPTLRAWASDPTGPVGSRTKDFEPEPSEFGRWFMGGDGSLTWDPKYGTYRLHDCTRPAAQPVAETLTEAVT